MRRTGKARPAVAIDQHAATELDLYAENTSELYGQFTSIIAHLKRKIKNGTYNAAMAPKLWMYWYDAAAKRYHREFGYGGTWSAMFPKALREHCAKERAKDEYQKIKAGEYGAV